MEAEGSAVQGHSWLQSKFTLYIKCIWKPDFANKVLLEHGPTHSFIIYGYFHASSLYWVTTTNSLWLKSFVYTENICSMVYLPITYIICNVYDNEDLLIYASLFSYFCVPCSWNPPPRFFFNIYYFTFYFSFSKTLMYHFPGSSTMLSKEKILKRHLIHWLTSLSDIFQVPWNWATGYFCSWSEVSWRPSQILVSDGNRLFQTIVQNGFLFFSIFN